jgi:carbonyl reductase 1
MSVGHTVITGSNRGLGAGLAAHLSDRPLVLTAREPSGSAKAEQLDISDERSVIAFSGRLRDHGVRISALVNNAAIYLRTYDATTAKRTLATNVFGTLQLIDALVPLFTQDARIVNVSSGMGVLNGYSPEITARFRAAKTRADVEALAHAYLAAATTPDGAAAAGFLRDPYSVSKALLNALTRVLAAELAPRKITVVAVSPGWVKTDMGGTNAPRDLATGVASLAYPLTAPVQSGHFYYDGKEIPY